MSKSIENRDLLRISLSKLTRELLLFSFFILSHHTFLPIQATWKELDSVGHFGRERIKNKFRFQYENIKAAGFYQDFDR